MNLQNTTFRKTLILAAAVIFMLFLPACRSYQKNSRGINDSFYKNDLSKTSNELAAQQKKSANKKSTDLLKLEESISLMCQGDFKRSTRLLCEVRDTFDDRDNQKFKSASETALSMLTDDQSISYRGEDHEKVLIRVMLAINSLMTDGQDAVAYSHQINMKQEEIIHRGAGMSDPGAKTGNPKQSYRMLAIGPYITGIMWEESMLERNEVARAYTKVTQWAPGFLAGKQDLQRAQNGVHSQRGNGAVYVITLLGKGPNKVQTSAPATQLSLLIADRIVSATSKHSVPPTIAPVPIPEIKESVCRFQRVDVTADRNPAYRVPTETITDINQIARQQFEANRDWIIARAVARRVTKKAAVYGAKEATNTKSAAGEILLDVAGVIWEATEEADTRCWSLLPGKIQVARMELPAGEHEISLEPVSGGAGRGETYKKKVYVRDGRNTYVLAYIADDGLIGKVQSSCE